MRGSRNKTDQGKVKEECEGNFYQTKSDNNIKVQIQAGLFSRPCRIEKQEDTVDEVGINRCNCPATSFAFNIFKIGLFQFPDFATRESRIYCRLKSQSKVEER